MNTYEEDFTVENYARLISLAKSKYQFISYSDLKKVDQFVLWRHDCDFSLNRALRLAEIENKLGVTATYFLNPHSDFYNVLERSQSDIIEKIIGFGHSIGLHFDTAYYDIKSTQTLDELVNREKILLQDFCGVKIDAFSFHNPQSFELNCEAFSYGGLINCYSKWMKENVSYCSDSNGYWRHERLENFLKDSNEACLQILTHPGWWQDSVMRPFDRIARCAHGRAEATLQFYKNTLQLHGRENIGYTAKFVQEIKN